jgi:hypothetical protein
MRILPTAALVLALFASACKSPAGPSPPPTIAGAWVSEVNNIRITLDLTETPRESFLSPGTFVPSLLDVEGSGTLTSLSSGESVAFRASGSNTTDHQGVGSVMINFFVQPNMHDGLYGQFRGAIRGGTLVGAIQNDFPNAIGPFFGPESVTVVFSRP